MPDLLHEGGLTMAIYRKKTKAALELEGASPDGRAPSPNERVADFSYQNESLAQMIVYAWTDEEFKAKLLVKSNVKALLAERGIYLSNPHVITEEDYFNGHLCNEPDEVVFVLPNKPRIANPPPGETLLETAKLLMACTPNGI
jgi:hypothetical protein